jgi:peroxiredoxin
MRMRRHKLDWISSLLTLSLFAATAALAGPKDAELEIGAKAPGFELRGTDGKKHSLEGYLEESKATVVIFTCNTCPYSQAYEPVLLEMVQQLGKQPVSFVLINSNSPEVQPGDSFKAMVERAKEKKYPFDYLQDETQDVATAYGAQRTPHVFLLDADGVLRYRGRIDDNVKREEVKSHDLSAAIQALLAGEEVTEPATKAFGCTIKWKKTS